ncbi:dolichol-phosphate mannosyltransferase [Romeria aff. gracilis LEGE 07310]|uniref:Dolichol-phosphate mannosyltransferase n=1 Tax=Vasconcelosia minhoensis LEGE 07310 TaxID=915328 RepID=A0A8J7DCB1_9CYAN|nr:dolichol-phosphate mannosyltransferase [Romeria gracilis]MBE9078712.1 dolichol-phosphate mannosyltransferase [Romeria aff. gracilis LEGE 07310]
MKDIAHRSAQYWLWPWLTILTGLLLTLWLQTYSQDGVFFSGDGGLKALLAQQLGMGTWQIGLDLPTPAPWITDLWQQGLYPFTPPYVYEQGTTHFITFPFTFPAVTAPFYALLGHRGLYVVPLISLWLLWGRFYQIGLRLGLRPAVLAAGLGCVILASPLSLYGAMYWEHTLAVALAFWGLTAVVFPPATGRAGRPLGGVLMGLAVWFRPEFLCLVAGVTLLLGLGWLGLGWLQLGVRQSLRLLAAMLLTVLVFFGLNFYIYGHPLGIHAIQIVEGSSPLQQLTQAGASYRQLLTSLFRYFPIALFAIAFTLTASLNSRLKLSPTMRWLLLLSLLFALSVPLIVPPGAGGKQWGPRFYLILVPLLSLVVAQQLEQVWDSLRGLWRGGAIALLALLFAFGLQLNTVQGAFSRYEDPQTGSISLPHSYAPIAPAISTLRAQPLPWVAMSHQFVAQQLWAGVPEKTFFRAESLAQVKQLAQALAVQNESAFLYVCYPHRDCPIPETVPAALSLEAAGKPAQLVFQPMGNAGKYPLYTVRLVTRP